MCPRHSEKPVPALTGNGLQEVGHAGGLNTSLNSEPQHRTQDFILPRRKAGRPSAAGPAIPTRSVDIIAKLDAARATLDRDTKLIQWALDIREQLEFGLDLDLMAGEVAALKRACKNREAA